MKLTILNPAQKVTQMLTLATLTVFASTASGNGPTLHNYENAIEHQQALGDFEATRTVRFNLGATACLSRVEVTVAPSAGNPTLYLFGGEAHHPDPLDQDLSIGTMTLASPAPARYTFRVERMTSQTFLKVSGGSVRILAAHSIVVPDRMCPEMARFLASGWAKDSKYILNLFGNQFDSVTARTAHRNLSAQVRVLELAIGAGSKLSNLTNYRTMAADTQPHVRQAALALACNLTEEVLPFGEIFSPRAEQYISIFAPLDHIRSEIFETYGTSAIEECLDTARSRASVEGAVP